MIYFVGVHVGNGVPVLVAVEVMTLAVGTTVDTVGTVGNGEPNIIGVGNVTVE